MTSDDQGWYTPEDQDWTPRPSDTQPIPIHDTQPIPVTPRAPVASSQQRGTWKYVSDSDLKPAPSDDQPVAPRPTLADEPPAKTDEPPAKTDQHSVKTPANWFSQACWLAVLLIATPVCASSGFPDFAVVVAVTCVVSILWTEYQARYGHTPQAMKIQAVLDNYQEEAERGHREEYRRQYEERRQRENWNAWAREQHWRNMEQYRFDRLNRR